MPISTSSGFMDRFALANEQASPTVPIDLYRDRPERSPFGGCRALRVKHAADRVISLVALIILFPFLLLIAVAVRLSGPGPVLFVQERIGQGGRPFRMAKFRSMRTGANAQLGELLRRHGRDGEPFFKIPDDPRVTGVGRLLRRWSLDELPQLWNVVAGQMSLVGPRPQVPAEVALYRDHEHARLGVRPGITGLWQVSGRSAVSWKLAMRLDLYYVENWSLLLDAMILWRTVGAVLHGRGAQ